MNRFMQFSTLCVVLLIHSLFSQSYPKFMDLPYESNQINVTNQHPGGIWNGWYYSSTVSCAVGDKHYGIDYDLSTGSNIKAVDGGTVIYVLLLNENYWPNYPTGTVNGVSPGTRAYGTQVRILHDNGFTTVYGHLDYSKVFVKQGDRVKKGQVIAYSGNTGYSSDPHLHMDVWNSTENGGKDCNGSAFYKYDPYDVYSADENDYVTTLGQNRLWSSDPPSYSQTIHAGYYSYGWNANGTSQAIVNRYLSFMDNESPHLLGLPRDNGGSAFVHTWEGVTLQDFYGENTGFYHGYTAIILSPNGMEAHLLKEGFWEWYMTNRNYGTEANPDYKPQGFIELGAPTSDEYEVQGQGSLVRQDFELGYLDYTPATNVQPYYYGSGGSGFSVYAQLLVENYVTIESDPIGAQIWDGTTQLTTTPLVLYLNESQTKTLTAKMSGYYDKEFTVDWQDGQEVVLY